MRGVGCPIPGEKNHTQRLLTTSKWYHMVFHISPVQFVSATSEETPGVSTGFCFDALVRSHQMPFLTIFHGVSWLFPMVSCEDPKIFMFIFQGTLFLRHAHIRAHIQISKCFFPMEFPNPWFLVCTKNSILQLAPSKNRVRQTTFPSYTEYCPCESFPANFWLFHFRGATTKCFYSLQIIRLPLGAIQKKNDGPQII